MAMPTKLSYNPLTKLENIIWGKIEGGLNHVSYLDAGCLRNYDTVRYSGWETQQTFTSISSMPISYGVPDSDTTGRATYSINKNTKLTTLVKDLITYYPLYYAFGIHIRLDSNWFSMIKRYTDTYYTGWSFFNLFNIQLYFTYNRSNIITFTIYFCSNNNSYRKELVRCYTQNTYMNHNNTVGIMLILYMMVTPTNSTATTYKILNRWTNMTNLTNTDYIKTLFDLNTNYTITNFISNFNPNTVVSMTWQNKRYASGLTTDGFGGDTAFVISPKSMSIAQIKDYLTKKWNNSSRTNPVYDIDDYLGETNIKLNLIRHVYNDDPLCFIFG